MAADKYTKKAAPEEAAVSPPADAWKDSLVVKEHTPAKQSSDISYRQLESQVADCDAQIASQTDRKAALEAEMAKVKSAVEA
tara:strand:+ start:702 stop:947 length:246 start_codon:yes stop_codon:yes gene_type:complete